MDTNKYIRIPFKEHGRGPHGADCWGLACIIFREELGIELPLMDDDYEHTKDKKISDLIKSGSVFWDAIPAGQEKAFDVAVFRMLGRPMHIGVVVKPGRMIHCERGSGVYLTDYNKEGQWDKRLEGFYRYATSPSIASTVSPS
jgi:cell wall-associated NlpC family hydrolase